MLWNTDPLFVLHGWIFQGIRGFVVLFGSWEEKEIDKMELQTGLTRIWLRPSAELRFVVPQAKRFSGEEDG